MDFQHNEDMSALRRRIDAFMDEHVFPVEHLYREQVHASGDPATRTCTPPVLQQLKAKARAEGLWNLFLPGGHGAGLSNLGYAPLAESMGRVLWASEVFNCSAPDTGNMEGLAQYGTPEQQRQWLEPLLAGTMRSSFSMTEPEVASSDATNIRCEIRRAGDFYVINGRKWFTSGALNEECKLLIVMGQTAPEHADVHKRQSMILVPKATPGVRIVRDMNVFGYDDAPVGHPEIMYENVRVPVANLLLGEGRGFEIAQGRLGPGRIHHCMRLIGCAQRALELMCRRATLRSAFGKPIGEHGSVREDIAHSYCDIEQARLLTLRAADKMDREGARPDRGGQDRRAGDDRTGDRPCDAGLRRCRRVTGHLSRRGLCLRALHAHGRRPRPGASVGAGQGAAQAPWWRDDAGHRQCSAADALECVDVLMGHGRRPAQGGARQDAQPPRGPKRARLR